ncbi:unnamed protein product [Calypogeia fissa]
MNTIFHDLLDQGVVIFIDDILVYLKTLEEQEQLLKEVFKRLRKAHLFAKPSKCEFAMEEIQFLGHTFTKDGITHSQDKLSDIKDWERPATTKQVRSFLGFMGFYRRYVKDFAKISRPLSALTMKNKVFVWTQECEVAFLELKRAMVELPVLKPLEVGKLFEIWTDASDFSIGTCLHQDGRPVAFESCKLENHWITLELRHVPGKVNAATDALLRKDCHRANSILMLETEWPKVLAGAYEDDRIAQEWQRNGGKRGSIRHVSWVLDKEHDVHLWRYKQTRVYVPESLRLEILQKYHDSPWGGHGGQAATYRCWRCLGSPSQWILSKDSQWRLATMSS